MSDLAWNPEGGTLASKRARMREVSASAATIWNTLPGMGRWYINSDFG